MALDVTLIDPRELDEAAVATWRSIQERRRELHGPYFCVEFVQLVAEARDGLTVAVLCRGDRTVGFFPFHQVDGVARPVAGALTDFQGLIIDPAELGPGGLDPQELLRACGLRRWHYDHLLTTQSWFEPGHDNVAPSPVMDLSSGFEAYDDDRRRNGGSRYKDLGRRRRRIEREVGPLRFEAHTDDRAVFEQVLAWKSAQFVRTGLDDPFLTPWVRDLVERVRGTRSEDFSGALSALWAGDHLVAAHLGMHSRHAWHYWFPTYDHEYSRYSPGFLLLIDIAREAAARGMHSLDLGRGDDAYKKVFGGAETLVADGHIALPSLRWEVEKAATRARSTAVATAKDLVKRSPLAEPLRRVLGRGDGAPDAAG